MSHGSGPKPHRCKRACLVCIFCYRWVVDGAWRSRCGHPALVMMRQAAHLPSFNDRLFRCEGCRRPIFYDVYSIPGVEEEK